MAKFFPRKYCGHCTKRQRPCQHSSRVSPRRTFNRTFRCSSCRLFKRTLIRMMFNLSEQRLFLLPNPSRFSINDVNFGVTSVDTLYHVKKEEYIKRGTEVAPIPLSPGDPGNDPMANLCRHLLQQRRYAPRYPFWVKLIQDDTQFLSFISSPNRCITGSESECYTPRWPPNGR